MPEVTGLTSYLSDCLSIRSRPHCDCGRSGFSDLPCHSIPMTSRGFRSFTRPRSASWLMVAIASFLRTPLLVPGRNSLLPLTRFALCFLSEGSRSTPLRNYTRVRPRMPGLVKYASGPREVFPRGEARQAFLTFFEVIFVFIPEVRLLTSVLSKNRHEIYRKKGICQRLGALSHCLAITCEYNVNKFLTGRATAVRPSIDRAFTLLSL